MSLDPVKIPQNVYIEDRIIGPLTLKQIIIMTLGGGFSYILYTTIQKAMGHPSILMTVLAWIPAAIAALFAVVKFNDLSLLRICFLILERMNKAPRRTWNPRQGISINIRFSSAKVDEKATTKEDAVAKAAEQKIGELSSIMDRPIAATAVESATISPPNAAMASDTQTTEQTVAVDNVAPAETARPSFPVDPSKVTVSDAHPQNPTLSDLTVFRDIFTDFPQSAQ